MYDILALLFISSYSVIYIFYFAWYILHLFFIVVIQISFASHLQSLVICCITFFIMVTILLIIMLALPCSWLAGSWKPFLIFLMKYSPSASSSMNSHGSNYVQSIILTLLLMSGSGLNSIKSWDYYSNNSCDSFLDLTWRIF